MQAYEEGTLLLELPL